MFVLMRQDFSEYPRGRGTWRAVIDEGSCFYALIAGFLEAYGCALLATNRLDKKKPLARSSKAMMFLMSLMHMT